MLGIVAAAVANHGMSPPGCAAQATDFTPHLEAPEMTEEEIAAALRGAGDDD